MKKLLTLTSALLITSAALAQTTEIEWVEIDDDVLVTPWGIEVEELEDRDVFNAAGEEIGEVEAVLGTEEGVASAVAIEVEEGLFNDDDTVVVQLADLALQDDLLVINLSAEQIDALPEWDD